MQTFTLAHDYADETGRPLRSYLRFGHKATRHVGQRASATQFLSRKEAEAASPDKTYYVDPRAKTRGEKKGEAKSKYVLTYRGRPCRLFGKLEAAEDDGGRYVRIQFEKGRKTAIVDNEELQEREGK